MCKTQSRDPCPAAVARCGGLLPGGGHCAGGERARLNSRRQRPACGATFHARCGVPLCRLPCMWLPPWQLPALACCVPAEPAAPAVARRPTPRWPRRRSWKTQWWGPSPSGWGSPPPKSSSGALVAAAPAGCIEGSALVHSSAVRACAFTLPPRPRLRVPRWSLQNGFVPLPKSNHAERQRTNLDVFRWGLRGATARGSGGTDWHGRFFGAGSARCCKRPPSSTHGPHVPAAPPCPWPARFELPAEDMAALDGLDSEHVTGWNPIKDDPV